MVQNISVHEFLYLREATFYHDRAMGRCPLVIYPAKKFKFNQNYFIPSDNLIVAEARVSDEPEEGRGIDPQSLQLILSALYDNFIYRPLKSLGNFLIVTKSIFYDPSTRVEEKYLIS